MEIKLQIHEFALMLPEATGDERLALREDIRKHGVKVPIVLFGGKILDGRSRYTIATELRIPFRTENFYGTAKDALALVASFNLYRRHLTPSQKAMVAADISVTLQRMDSTPAPEARRIAAEATGASKDYIRKAEKYLEEKPRMAMEIRNGETTIGELDKHYLKTCPICGHRF